jgi:hypothetical protein
MNHLATHFPSGMVFDDSQKKQFGTPEQLEQFFQKETHREFIDINYLGELNDLLQEIHQTFSQYNTKSYESINETCGVLNVDIIIYYDEDCDKYTIALEIVRVRPCFASQKIFTILVYLLLKLACHRHDVKEVRIEACTDATVNILMRRFKSMVTHEVEQETGWSNCIFSNFDSIREQVTPTSLGIDMKVVEDPNDGSLQLVESQFPTANELNDDKWVEEHYQKPTTELDEEIKRCEQELLHLTVNHTPPISP